MSKRLPIFYNALLLTGVNLLLRFVSTSFQIYLSGKIGPEGIGLLQLILSVGGLALTAGMAGIRTATMYLTAEELGKRRPQNVRWVLSGCVRYSLVCSCAVSVLLYYFSPLIAPRWIGNGDIVSSVRLFAFFLPVNCLCGVMVGYYTAANRVGTLAIVEVVEQVCSMGLTVSLLHFWAQGDVIRSCASVVMGGGFSGCFTLICLIVLSKIEKVSSVEKIPIRNRLLHTAVPLAIADDLKSGITTAENLMVPKRLALCERVNNPLASFGIVCGMVFPILMFPAAILFGLAELLIPELARCSAAGSQKRIQYLAKRSLTMAILYGCLFGGALYVTSQDLCLMLYDSKEAGKYLRLFSVLAPMLYSDAITDAMIKGLGQQTACVRYNILTTGLDVLLLFFLLPKYGMEGYYFSFLLTHLLNFILSLRRLLKITGKLISLKIPVLAFIVTVVSACLSSTLPTMLLRCGAYFFVVGSLMLLLRVISGDDILWVKNLVMKKQI